VQALVASLRPQINASTPEPFMKPMPKRRLVAALLKRGCRKLSESGIHEKWGCPCGQHTTSVPRQAEISAGVVRKIGRHMACLPEGWLR
jgi:hypothetical protein